MAAAGSGKKEKEMQTHIYIVATPKQIRSCERKYAYLIAADNSEYRRMEFNSIDSASYEKAVLKAVTEALDKFKPRVKCQIMIHCEDKWLKGYVLKELKDTWQFCGWKNKRGKDLANKDLWQLLYNQIYELGAKTWEITWETGEHRYSRFLRTEMKHGTETREIPE